MLKGSHEGDRIGVFYVLESGLERGSHVTSCDHYEIDEPEDWDRPTPPRVRQASRYVDGSAVIGEVNVTFDRKTSYNLFPDFLHAFTQGQIDIIREELPFWYAFFKSRITS